MLFRLSVFFYINILFSSYSMGAVETYHVNKQDILIKSAVFMSGELSKGDLAVKTDIRFGVNILKGVPENTNLYFSTNLDGSRYISLMIFSQAFENQVWKVFNGELNLNCSPHEGGGRVVAFYSNHQIEGRCRSVSEQSIATPNEGRVTLGVGSEIFLTKDGKLKSVKNLKNGYIYINGQKILLKEKSSLDFHNEGKPHFFYMKEGEGFNISTSLSKNSRFEQLVHERVRPFVFHLNGQIDSGRFVGGEEVLLEILILSQKHQFKFFDGQVGFDKKGRLNRVIIKKDLNFVLNEDAILNFIDVEGNKIPFELKKGESFPIVKGTHLFLTYNLDEVPVLKGFPLIIEGKKYFFSLN